MHYFLFLFCTHSLIPSFLLDLGLSVALYPTRFPPCTPLPSFASNLSQILETSKDRVKRYSLQTLTSSQSAHDLCTSRDPQPLTPTADTPPAQPPLPTTTSHSNTRRPRTPIRKPMNITSLETLNEVDRPLPELTTRRRTQSNVDFETGDSDGHEEDYSVC